MSRLRAVTTGVLDLEKRDGEGEDGFQALAPGMGPASMLTCRHLHSMSAGKYLNSMLRVQHAVSSPSHGQGHCVRSLKFALREGPGTQGPSELWELHCASPRSESVV